MKSHDWIFLLFTTIICCTATISLAQAQQRGRVKFALNPLIDESDLSPSSEKPSRPPRMRSASPRTVNRVKTVESSTEDNKDAARSPQRNKSRGRSEDISSKKLEAEATDFVTSFRQRKRVNVAPIVDQPMKIQLPTASVERKNVIRQSRSRVEAPVTSGSQDTSSTSSSAAPHFRRRSDVVLEESTENIRKIRTFTSRSATRRVDEDISSEVPLVITTVKNNWKSPVIRRGAAKAKIAEFSPKPLDDDQLEDENYPEHFKLLLKKKQQPKTASPPRNIPRPPLDDEPTYAKSNEIDDVTKASGRSRRLEKTSQENSAEVIQVPRLSLPKVRQVELRREDTARAPLKSRRVEASVDELISLDVVRYPLKTRRTEKQSEENLSGKFNSNDGIRSAFKTQRIDSKIEEIPIQVKSEEAPRVSFKSRRTEPQSEEGKPQEKPNEIVQSTKASKPLFIPRRAEPYRPKPSTTTARTTTTVRSSRKPEVDVRAKFKPRVNGRLQFPSLKTKTIPLSEEVGKDENEIVNSKPSLQAVRVPQITKPRNPAFDKPIVDAKSKTKSQKFSSRYRGDAYSRYQQKTEPSKPIYTPTIPAVTTEPVIPKSDLPQPRTAKAITLYNPESHDLNKPDGKYTGVVFDEKAGVWNMVEPVAGGLTRSEISVDSPDEHRHQSAVTVSIFEALAEILSKTPTTTSTTTTTTTTSTTTSTTELPDIIQVPEINIDSMQIPSTTVNTHLITDVDIEYTTTNEITNNERNGRVLNSVDINQQPSTVTAIPITTSIDPTESQETTFTTIPENSETSPLITQFTQQTESSTLALPASPTQPTFTNTNPPGNLNANSLELTTLSSNPPTSLPLPHLADALTTPGSRLVTSPQLISAISNFLDTSVQNASETMATSTTSTTTTPTATTLDTDTEQVVNSTTTPEASTTLSPTTFFTYVPSSTASPPVTISFLDLFTIHPKKVNSNTEPMLDVHPVYREPDTTTPMSRKQKTFNSQAFFGTQTYPSIAITGGTSTDRMNDLFSTFRAAPSEDTVTSGVTTDTLIPSTTTLEQDTPTTTLIPITSSYLEDTSSQSPPIQLNSILGSTQKYDQTSPTQTVQQTTESTTTVRSRFGNNRLPILPAGSIRRVLPIERFTIPPTTSSTTRTTTITTTQTTSTPSTTSTTASTTSVTPETTPEVTPGQRQTSNEVLPDQQQFQQLPKPIKDFSVYGILPNNTVVRKRPVEVSRTLDVGVMVYGILPNRTVVRKYPNGTLAIVDSSQDVEVVDIDPKMLFNPFSELYRTSQSSLLLTTHRSTTSHRLIESNHIPGTGLSSTPSSDVSISTGSGRSAKGTTDDGPIGDASTTNSEDDQIIQLLNETEDNLLNSTSLVESNTENAVLLDLLKRKYIHTDIPSKSSNVVSLTTVKNVVEETSIQANKGDDVSENTIFDSSEEKSKDKSSSSEEDLLSKLFSQNGSAVATTPNTDDDNNIISNQFDTFAANVGRGSIFAGNKGRALQFSQRTKLYPIKLVMASQKTATKLFPIYTNQMATSVKNRSSVSIEDFTAELNRTRDVFESLANKTKKTLRDDVPKLIDLGILESEVDSETNGDYFMDPEDRLEAVEELASEGSGDGDGEFVPNSTESSDPWTRPPGSVPVQVVYSPDEGGLNAQNETASSRDSNSGSHSRDSITESPIELTTQYTTPSNLEEEYLIPVKVLYPEGYFEQVSKFIQNSIRNNISSSKPTKGSPPSTSFSKNSVFDFPDKYIPKNEKFGLGVSVIAENTESSNNTSSGVGYAMLADLTLVQNNSGHLQPSREFSANSNDALNLRTFNESIASNENMTELPSILGAESDEMNTVNASLLYGESDLEDTTSHDSYSDVLVVNDKDYPMESVPHSKNSSSDSVSDFEDDQLLKLVNGTRADLQNSVFSLGTENRAHPNLKTESSATREDVKTNSDLLSNLNVSLWAVLNETANSVLLDAFEPALNASDKVDLDNHVVPRKGAVLNVIDDDVNLLLEDKVNNINETFDSEEITHENPKTYQMNSTHLEDEGSATEAFDQSSDLFSTTSLSELLKSENSGSANPPFLKEERSSGGSFKQDTELVNGSYSSESSKSGDGFIANQILPRDESLPNQSYDQTTDLSNDKLLKSEEDNSANAPLFKGESLSGGYSVFLNTTSSPDFSKSKEIDLTNPYLLRDEDSTNEPYDQSGEFSNETSSYEPTKSEEGRPANTNLIRDESSSTVSYEQGSDLFNETAYSTMLKSEEGSNYSAEISEHDPAFKQNAFLPSSPPSMTNRSNSSEIQQVSFETKDSLAPRVPDLLNETAYSKDLTTFSPTFALEIETSNETFVESENIPETTFDPLRNKDSDIQSPFIDSLNSPRNFEFSTPWPELIPKFSKNMLEISTNPIDLPSFEVTTSSSTSEEFIPQNETVNATKNVTQISDTTSVLDRDSEVIKSISEIGRKGKSDSTLNRVTSDIGDENLEEKIRNVANADISEQLSRNLIKSTAKLGKNTFDHIPEKVKIPEAGMIVYPSSHHMNTPSPYFHSSSTEYPKPPSVYYPMIFPKKTAPEPAVEADIVMPTNMQAVLEGTKEPKHIEMVFPKNSKPKLNEMLPGHFHQMYTEEEEESSEVMNQNSTFPTNKPSDPQAIFETNSVAPPYKEESYIPVNVIYPPSYFDSTPQQGVNLFNESAPKSEFEDSVGLRIGDHDRDDDSDEDVSFETDNLKDDITLSPGKTVEKQNVSPENKFVPGGIPEYILRTMSTYSEHSVEEPALSSDASRDRYDDDFSSKDIQKNEDNYINSDIFQDFEENELKRYQVGLNLIGTALDQVEHEASGRKDIDFEKKDKETNFVEIQKPIESNSGIDNTDKEQFITFPSTENLPKVGLSDLKLNELTPDSQSYDSSKSSNFKPESLTKDISNLPSPQDPADPPENIVDASESPPTLTIESPPTNLIPSRPNFANKVAENPLANMSTLNSTMSAESSNISMSKFNPSSQSSSDELITDEHTSDSESNPGPYPLTTINQITQHASNTDVEPSIETAQPELVYTPENIESSSEAQNQNNTETQYTIQQHNYFHESNTISSLDNTIVIDNLKNSPNTITEPKRVENIPTPTIILVSPGSTLPATVPITTTPSTTTMPSTTTTTSTTPTTTTTTTTTQPSPPPTTTTTTTSTTPAPTTTTTTTTTPPPTTMATTTTTPATTTPFRTTVTTTKEITTPSSIGPGPQITVQPTAALASVNSELERNIKLLEQLLALQASLKPKTSNTTPSTTPSTTTTTTTTSTTSTTPPPLPPTTTTTTTTTTAKTISNQIKFPSATNAEDIQFLNTLRQLLLRQQQGTQKPSTSSSTTTTTTTTPRTTTITTTSAPVTISQQNLQDLLNSFSTPTFTTTTAKTINSEDADFLNSLRDIGKLRVTTSTPPTFANRIIELALQNRQITPTTPIHITARTTTSTPPFTPLPAKKFPSILPAHEIERHRQDQAALSADLSLLSSLLGRRVTIADLPHITKQFSGGNRQPMQKPIPVQTTTLRTTPTTTRTTTEKPMTRDEIAEIEKNLNLLSSLLGRPVSLNELPLIMQELRSGRRPKGTASGARINLISPAAAKSTTTSRPRTTVNVRAQTPISQEEVIELLKDPSIGTAPEQLNIYGKTNDAVLAAVLKQRGIGPTHNNIPINDLFLQGPTPTPYHTTRSPPPPPPPTQRRPLLDGLAWLWRTWQDTAPGPRTSRNNRQPTAAASTRLESPLAVGGFGVAVPAAVSSDEGGEYAELQYPQNQNQSLGQGNGLLTAAFGVTRAVTQFLGAAFQGAAKSVQTAFAPQSLQQTNLIGLSG